MLRLFGGIGLLPLVRAALFRVRTYRQFVGTLIGTELGHLIGPLALLIAAVRRRTALDAAAALLCGGAGLALLSSLARAIPLALRIPAALAAAFGPRAAGGPLIAPLRLIWPARVHARVDTLAYARRAGRDLAFDLFRPDVAVGPLPIVIFIHGGGWQNGTRADWPGQLRLLAAQGYAVVSPSYRLLPEGFPAAQEDIAALLAYLREHAARLGLDASRIALAGRSAGSQIALVAAYSDPAIRAAIALYGPNDLVYGHAHPAPPAIMDTSALLEGLCGGTPMQAPATYAAASPAVLARPESPPTLLLYGGRDEIVSPVQGQILARRLNELGVPHLLITIPYATHGMDIVPWTPSGQICATAMARFLRATIGE